MNQTVTIDVFYPHPPEKVWKALTNSRALAAWLMNNNFEPRIGHRFQFYDESLPGLKTTIQCEVIELDAPNRLVYTWRDCLTSEPTLAIWTLVRVEEGTQLQLKHLESCYAAATTYRMPMMSPKRSIESGEIGISGLFLAEMEQKDSKPDSYFSVLVQSPQCFEWDYYLKQKLPQVLQQQV
jgi:uncharacterized protein YndB with AHSA1/START domain